MLSFAEIPDPSANKSAKVSAKILGTCKLTNMIGPLTKQDLELNIDKHQIPEDELANIIASYPKPHAWVLSE